jgi:nucleoside-diphosphate-sugar epimerase
MKILAIGGTGFIGKFAVPRLQQAGHSVTVFHRGKTAAPKGTSEIVGDRNEISRHRPTFARENFDAVIDFIVSSERQARALIETFRGVTRRVIALSSMDVYRAMGVVRKTEPGPLQEVPLTEGSDLRTRPQYSPEEIKVMHAILPWLDEEYEKIAAERALMSNQDLSATILRLPMIYGPGDYIHRFYYILRRMDDQRPAIIYADDMAAWRTPRGYVENVADAVVLAATSDRAMGRIFNVCEEDAFSELDWAKKIAAATGWRGEFVVLPADSAPPHLRAPGNRAQHLVASSQRIRQELGYREAVPEEEGIRRTIIWERAHPPQQVLFGSSDYEAEDATLRARRTDLKGSN